MNNDKAVPMDIEINNNRNRDIESQEVPMDIETNDIDNNNRDIESQEVPMDIEIDNNMITDLITNLVNLLSLMKI